MKSQNLFYLYLQFATSPAESQILFHPISYSHNLQPLKTKGITPPKLRMFIYAQLTITHLLVCLLQLYGHSVSFVPLTQFYIQTIKECHKYELRYNVLCMGGTLFTIKESLICTTSECNIFFYKINNSLSISNRTICYQSQTLIRTKRL